MHRLYGIETEYGIVVDGLTASDWIAESIAVVRAYDGKSVSGWNYRGEDPRRDMRGFIVNRLSVNPDDAKFDSPGVRPLTREEERSDRVLVNGARLYNDHGHPEYATPECADLRSLVAHDKAGERIVHQAAKTRSEQRGSTVTLYKNNTDYHGSSYGTHEAYLMLRAPETENLIAGLLPFFVSRPLYAGAGKCGVENDKSVSGDLFQLSQRADYFSVEASVDTLHNRPIFNTRDEPHATPSQYRRLHVICGDANMSEFANALKVGATALAIRLLEDGLTPPVRLSDSVRAARTVSRDVTLRATIEQVGGPPVTALEIQWLYQKEADRRYRGSDSDTDWTLDAWSSTLAAIEADPTSLYDKLDWAAKYRIFTEFRLENGLAWSDPHMQSLDLAYHDVDPDQGLYYGLVQAGEMQTLVTEAHIAHAAVSPPAETRAWIRGMFVDRFGSSVRSIGWNGVAFRHLGEDLLFDMNPLVDSGVCLLNDEFNSADTLDRVVEIVRSTKTSN